MKFFKPEDFYYHSYSASSLSYEQMAEIANAKLSREAKVVYFNYRPDDPTWTHIIHFENHPLAKHQALLINIEPIEKCTHPVEKIQPSYNDNSTLYYQCECGARVKPSSFEVAE